MYQKSNLRRIVGQWVLVGTGILLSGCGSSEESAVVVHPVQATVMYKGKPAGGALIALHPRQKGAVEVPNPRGTVQPDGSVKFTTYQVNDGAPEGEYAVTVQWFQAVKRDGDTVPGPNVLPAKYASAKTTDLKATIAPGSNELPAIKLQ